MAEVAPYLEALGISHAYLSPCFKASPGSAHGYDVTDHNAFNPELGSADAFDRMAATLAGLHMGVVLDVVPNHMGIGGDANPWWLDVLENGPSSPYAGFFDIHWAPVKAELRDRVLLPVLPDQYGRVLESQQLALELVEGAFVIRYAGARLPVAPETYPMVLGHRLDGLASHLGPDSPHLLELQSILTAIEHLPPRTVTEADRVAERLREKEIIKRRLAALVKEADAVRGFVEDNVRLLNGIPGDPRSFDRLDALLDAQVYRLADWRVAADEVNYRRFFDVNDLAAIRMESRPVFEATHRLVLRLVAAGAVHGLRIDHPDGLYAPGEYFQRLQDEALRATAARLVPRARRGDAGRAPDRAPRGGGRPAVRCGSWPRRSSRPTSSFPTGGRCPAAPGTISSPRSTGSSWTAGPPGSSRRSTAASSGRAPIMADVIHEAKRLIMQTTMASEISELGLTLDHISETNRLSRDFTRASLTRAIREVIAAFPVYRTYVGDRGGRGEPAGPRVHRARGGRGPPPQPGS